MVEPMRLPINPGKIQDDPNSSIVRTKADSGNPMAEATPEEIPLTTEIVAKLH
jgi:hypothetical protein